MPDNRRHKRFAVDDMEIHGKMVFASEVKVVNISISGISIKADRRLDIGSEYTLKIESSEKILSLRGVVVWSNICGSRAGSHGDQVPLYAAGLRFTDVLSDRMTELLDFIELHKTDPDHRVTGLRFRIDSAERAVMNFPSSYRVKRMSISGMLIESSQALEVDAKFAMEMSLPDDQTVRFTGKVSSCRLVPSKAPETYHIGISFLSMPEKDRERLGEFFAMLRDLNRGQGRG